MVTDLMLMTMTMIIPLMDTVRALTRGIATSANDGHRMVMGSAF